MGDSIVRSKSSIGDKIKASKNNGNHARNATYQLRSDINELMDLNSAIASITFLGTRQLLNQHRNDLVEAIFEELERQSDLSNLIDIEDVRIILETLLIEHRTYLNLKLQEINKKTIESEILQDDINKIREEANQHSLAFNEKLERYIDTLKQGDLSAKTLGISDTLIVEDFENRLSEADEQNNTILSHTESLSASIRARANYLEKKIEVARAIRAELEK